MYTFFLAKFCCFFAFFLDKMKKKLYISFGENSPEKNLQIKKCVNFFSGEFFFWCKFFLCNFFSGV
jgi:hypothetical protein